MILQYLSALGNIGKIEIDLNFIFRTPIWTPTERKSIAMGDYDTHYLLLDLHELVAGKLSALLDRSASRDLYDIYKISHQLNLDVEKLRLVSVVYGGMSATDWRTFSLTDLSYNHHELLNQLIPVLHKGDLDGMLNNKQWTQQLLVDCQNFLSKLFPLRENEIEFLTALLDFGEIKPILITQDDKISEILSINPGLKWKAMKVKM